MSSSVSTGVTSNDYNAVAQLRALVYSAAGDVC
jgi:hypothetical protein